MGQMSQGAVTLVVDPPKACGEVQLVVVLEWDDTLLDSLTEY